jgi:hypothetical protein
MNRVVLKRGWKELQQDPSLEDVLALMRIVEADGGAVGPPDLALEFLRQAEAGSSVTAELLFMLAFSATKPPLWLVQFSTHESKRIKYLATGEPVLDVFVLRTCCGLVEKFRQECLLERSDLLHEAILWFLKHGTACPSLTWLEYENVVRDADPIS